MFDFWILVADCLWSFVSFDILDNVEQVTAKFQPTDDSHCSTIRNNVSRSIVLRTAFIAKILAVTNQKPTPS